MVHIIYVCQGSKHDHEVCPVLNEHNIITYLEQTHSSLFEDIENTRTRKSAAPLNGKMLGSERSLQLDGHCPSPMHGWGLDSNVKKERQERGITFVKENKQNREMVYLIICL